MLGTHEALTREYRVQHSIKEKLHIHPRLCANILKLVRLRYWILPLFFFGTFVDLDFATVHKNTKKELSEYWATLTSSLINNSYVVRILVIYAAGSIAFPI